ncbi:MAG: Asp-tRNA(Asn)/Glu-tRNA(Gln) amidotransferase subunit GatB [Methanomassiliicoccaceae archaeon]|nr:Asp-tRNA(Asn)/Glu-tRNA(Gln) amidotransferase subunit GatB [Methanomassiliicoccaceae archaeon]
MKIGLEIHVQLPTRSKMFCSCPAGGAAGPNEHICPGCMGMPGTRPALNKEAIILGIKIAKLLNCTVPETIWFNRKIYFYPDLCRHYQITQYETPIAGNGVYYLGKKPIRINRAHLEEDPGVVSRSGDGSLTDYNRSGMPLIEIVTEPDIATPAEAREFLTALLKDIRHVIDLPDDGERSIRADCNISMKDSERCEVKNVSGLKNVERALTFEAVRQTKILKAGGRIARETRHYDADRMVTTSARKKEHEGDYAYVCESNLGKIDVKKIMSSVEHKESPKDLAARLEKEFVIDGSVAMQIVNTSVKLANLFEHLAKDVGPETSLKWVTGAISSFWKMLEKDADAKIGGIKDIIMRQKNGEINDVECSIMLKALITGKDDPAAKNDAALEPLIKIAIANNPSVLTDYKKSEKAANRIIGIIMKETGGSYSSSDIVEATKKILDELSLQ